VEDRDPKEVVRHLTRYGALLVAAGGVTGVLNLLFNVVVARRGGAANYGAIGSLLTVVTVVGIVATGLQYGIARQAVLSSGASRNLASAALRSLVPWAAAALVLAMLFWPLSGFLRLSSLAPVVLIIGVAVVSVFGAGVSGLLVGFQRFRVIAAIGVGAAALRLALGFLVGRGPDAVTFTLTISLVGLVASFLVGLLFLTVGKRAVLARPPAPEVARGAEDGGATRLLGAVMAGALWTIWGLPVLFARHLLNPSAAGDFAAAQLLAGALIWGTAPLVTAFFPTIARLRARGTFLYGEAATLGLALAGAAALSALGPFLVERLYGTDFLTSRSLLVVLSVSASATACATFATWSAMAGRTHVGPVLVALLVALGTEVVWDLLGAHTPIALAAAPAVSLILGGTAFATIARARTRPSADSVSLSRDSVGTSPAALEGER
jgi:O-antigen/teichoic acid export membrane protein